MKTLIICCIFFILKLNIVAQSHMVTWSSFNMGFEVSTSANISIISSIGQSFVGGSRRDNTNINSGFLVDTLFRGTAVSISEPVILPSIFTLSQNFPNPFNPSTKIKYSVAQVGVVTLKVYDILGREIETLVNEEKNAGYYEVNFDANRLASGIYIYKMQAGNFISSKKFILMK